MSQPSLFDPPPVGAPTLERARAALLRLRAVPRYLDLDLGLLLGRPTRAGLVLGQDVDRVLGAFVSRGVEPAERDGWIEINLSRAALLAELGRSDATDAHL